MGVGERFDQAKTADGSGKGAAGVSSESGFVTRVGGRRVDSDDVRSESEFYLCAGLTGKGERRRFWTRGDFKGGNGRDETAQGEIVAVAEALWRGR